MIINEVLRQIGLLVGILLLATPTSAQMTFSSANDTGNGGDEGTWNVIFAQGFRPSLEATPDPGLSAGETVFMNQFSFFKSGFSDSASDIQLAIVDNLFYDYTVPLTTTSTALIGLSTNTVSSTAALVENDPILFDFDSMPLTYGSDYAAVFVNDDGAGTLTPVLVSGLTENYIENSSGVFLPASNYGTDDQFQYSTSNFLIAGFFDSFDFAGDARFRATFSTVPEPQSWMLMSVFAMGILITRSRFQSR